MFWYEIVSLIISILSLIASGLISFAVFYMGKKVENKRYRADIEYQARKFIIDHGDNDILYLPYCIIASGVNRHHKHLRQIYNDFDALPNDVQKEVLKQAGYDYQIGLTKELRKLKVSLKNTILAILFYTMGLNIFIEPSLNIHRH